MNTDEIAKARALCEAATAGPWVIENENDLDNSFMISPTPTTISDHTVIMDCVISEPNDLFFITASRTLLPAALDEIERLRGLIKRLGMEYERWERTVKSGERGTWPRDRFESHLESALEEAGFDWKQLLAELDAEQHELPQHVRTAER